MPGTQCHCFKNSSTLAYVIFFLRLYKHKGEICEKVFLSIEMEMRKSEENLLHEFSQHLKMHEKFAKQTIFKKLRAEFLSQRTFES